MLGKRAAVEGLLEYARQRGVFGKEAQTNTVYRASSVPVRPAPAPVQEAPRPSVNRQQLAGAMEGLGVVKPQPRQAPAIHPDILRQASEPSIRAKTTRDSIENLKARVGMSPIGVAYNGARAGLADAAGDVANVAGGMVSPLSRLFGRKANEAVNGAIESGVQGLHNLSGRIRAAHDYDSNTDPRFPSTYGQGTSRTAKELNAARQGFRFLADAGAAMHAAPAAAKALGGAANPAVAYRAGNAGGLALNSLDEMRAGNLGMGAGFAALASVAGAGAVPGAGVFRPVAQAANAVAKPVSSAAQAVAPALTPYLAAGASVAPAPAQLRAIGGASKAVRPTYLPATPALAAQRP